MIRLSLTRLIDLEWRYTKHRYNATQRGIGFELTFSEWLDIWISSERVFQRGTRRGAYVMARHGDSGPYAPGNVRIITHSENVAQAHRGRTRSKETKLKLSIKAKRRWKEWRALDYRGRRIKRIRP